MESLFDLPIPRVDYMVELGLACGSFAVAMVCAFMLDMRSRKPKLVRGVIIGFIATAVFACGTLTLVLPGANVHAADYVVVIAVNLALALGCLIGAIFTVLYSNYTLTALVLLPMGPTLVVSAATSTRIVNLSWDRLLVDVVNAGIIATLVATAGCILTGIYLLVEPHWQSRWPFWQ